MKLDLIRHVVEGQHQFFEVVGLETIAPLPKRFDGFGGGTFQ